MKPLFVLLTVFILSTAAIKLISNNWNFSLAGTIAMSMMLLFTSIGHFVFSKGMAMMIPDILPFKKQLVFITGIMEIMAAIALLVPAWKNTAGVFLILFFVLMLPANISAAVNKVDYQKGNYEGTGLNYLWFRIPLQLFFIAWVYWFIMR